MKLRWVVLFNIDECITLKEPLDILSQWLTIGQGLNGTTRLQRCGTMWMKNLLVANYPFLHRGVQLLVVA
jgi:hypothetical protein